MIGGIPSDIESGIRIQTEPTIKPGFLLDFSIQEERARLMKCTLHLHVADLSGPEGIDDRASKNPTNQVNRLTVGAKGTSADCGRLRTGLAHLVDPDKSDMWRRLAFRAAPIDRVIINDDGVGA